MHNASKKVRAIKILGLHSKHPVENRRRWFMPATYPRGYVTVTYRSVDILAQREQRKKRLQRKKKKKEG